MLVNGDHSTDSRGIPVRIDGVREIIQRALLRLCVKKGSFTADPSLGSDLYKLRGSLSSNNLERLALGYVQEALLPMPEITVESVAPDWTGPNELSLTITLIYDENSYDLEVEIP